MYGLKGVSIWIDDLRPGPVDFRVCRTYDEAIAAIDYFSKCESGIDLICFDHDLGEDKSGYDIAKFIVENHIPIESYSVHSMNPVGRKNICELLDHYGYKQLKKII